MIKIFFGEQFKVEDGKVKFLALDLSKGEIGEFQNEYIRNWLKNIEKYLGEEKLEIYYDNSPQAMCGFYFVVTCLKNANVEILAHKLVEGNKYWRDYEEDYSKASATTWELSSNDIVEISMKWSELVKEKTNLRVVLNGELKSVGDDFYDYFILNILKGVNHEWLRVSHLLAEVIRQIKGTDSELLKDRVRALIKSGVLTIRHEDNNFLRNMVKIQYGQQE